MKILRVLIFAVFWRINLDPQKLVPAEKKHPQNITPQKLTSLGQTKNSACNRLLPLKQYTLDLNKNINMIFHLKKQLELSRVKQFSTFIGSNGSSEGKHLLMGS